MSRYWNQKKEVKGRKHSSIGSSRRFGIELEVCTAPRHEALQNRTSFGAKHDGSVSGESMEFVSPILSGDRGLEAVTNFCEYARQHNWRADRSCGYHLHIDVSQMDGWRRRKVAYAYAVTQRFWKRLVPSWRRNARWCANMQTRPTDWKREGSFNNLSFNNTRYCWCNTSAYQRHGTIEIRLHQGTLRTREIVNWIKLHLWFVDRVSRMKWDSIDRHLTGKSPQQIYATLFRACSNKALLRFYREKAHFHDPKPRKRKRKSAKRVGVEPAV
jgi:hypothetical protein